MNNIKRNCLYENKITGLIVKKQNKKLPKTESWETKKRCVKKYFFSQTFAISIAVKFLVHLLKNVKMVLEKDVICFTIQNFY